MEINGVFNLDRITIEQSDDPKLWKFMSEVPLIFTLSTIDKAGILGQYDLLVERKRYYVPAGFLTDGYSKPNLSLIHI